MLVRRKKKAGKTERKMSNFWKSILSSKDPSSSKRLVTLIISFHFIVSSFAILFVAFYVIFKMPKGQVNTDLLSLLEKILEYDFYIILSGLGFIAADNLGQIMLERAKQKYIQPVPPDEEEPIEIEETTKPE